MDLLLDIGNSRLKWALSNAGEMHGYGFAPRNDDLFVDLAERWKGLPRPDRIIAANVAGAAFAAKMNKWVDGYWRLPVGYVSLEQGWGGLNIAYRQPSLFGVDRWLALIGARHLHEGSLCVIDCGTAVTIDAVTASGNHIGGIIMPGLALMSSSLLQRSTGVIQGYSGTAEPCDTVLGCDTRSGIEQGALYAVSGAIQHTLERIKASMGEPITSIITGGDAACVMAEITVAHNHPHLVLQGLQCLAKR